MSDNPADTMPFSKLMGVKVTRSTKESIVGELLVRPDALGAIGGFLNLPAGAKGTTTIESKTNFLAAAPEGTTVLAETAPVNVGRRLSVWQTTIKREDGKVVALVTQTQMVL